MVRDIRVKEYRFSVGSLTANTGGLFSVYSDHAINGTIQAVYIGSNNYTNTGSLAIYASGTDNSVENDLVIRVRAGSMMKTVYPFVQMVDNQSLLWTAGSTNFTQFVLNAPLRVVGSALGNGTSGVGITIRYI